MIAHIIRAILAGIGTSIFYSLCPLEHTDVIVYFMLLWILLESTKD